MTVAIALGASVVKATMPNFQNVGGLIGTFRAVSLRHCGTQHRRLFRRLRGVSQCRGGGPYEEKAVDAYLADRGVLGRFFRPLMKFIGRSWHMYPLDLLFGLGFDTATAVRSLLSTVGMSLLDTTDGILMLGAYGWAYVKPIRKLSYNLTITFVSIAVALLVGTIEALGIVANQLGLKGGFWDGPANISGNLGALGFAIVAVFLASWAGSTLIYKTRRYDDIDAALTTDAAPKE